MDYGGSTEHEQKLIGLQQYTRRLLSTETRAETARVAVQAAHDVLGAPLVGIHDYDAETATLGTLASVDTVREELGEKPTYRRDGGDRIERIVWGIFETGETAYIDDMATYDAAAAQITPASSGILQPLDDGGVFITSATKPGAFDESDRALLEILVDTLEAALRRVEREQLLQQRTRQLRRENERLEEFAGVVSHDLRSPLNVAVGRVGLATEAAEDAGVVDQLTTASSALDRALELVDDLLTLAREGKTVEATERVPLAAAARAAWDRVETGAATLTVRLDDERIDADRSRLLELFENLFRNCVEHADQPVSVAVGTLDTGFYVDDDGPGIPEPDRQQVFERGYTTSDAGSGFGLRIVRDIAGGHGWSVTATDSDAGGTRIEITGVTG